MFLVDFLLKLFGIRKDKVSPKPSTNGNGNGNGRGRHGRHGRHAGNNRQSQQKGQPQQKGPQQQKSQPRGSQQNQQRGQQPRGGQPQKGQKPQNQQSRPPRQQQPQQQVRPQKPQTPPQVKTVDRPEAGPQVPQGPVTVAVPPPVDVRPAVSERVAVAQPSAPTVSTPSKDDVAVPVVATPVEHEPVVSVPVVAPSEPTEATSTEPAMGEDFRQIVYVVRADVKLTVLKNLIRSNMAARTVVFCNKKMVAEDTHRALAVEGFKCGLLTGDVNEDDRAYVLRAFASGEIPLVVVTDGFDAGIHAGAVDYVVNYDFPYEPADYVRRIGDVGKVEGAGRVVSFADEDESFAIPEIEEHLGASLKCRVLAEDDPLLGEPAVVPEGEGVESAEPEPEPLYTHIEGGVPVFDAQGREGRVVLGGGTDPRPLPSFETALNPKNVLNEENVYLKAAANPDRGGEWTVSNAE